MKIDVKAVRESTGLTNIQISKKIGCSSQWLTNIEREDKFPKTLVSIIKLSELSCVPIDKLIVDVKKKEEEELKIIIGFINRTIKSYIDPVQKYNAEKLLDFYEKQILLKL